MKKNRLNKIKIDNILYRNALLRHIVQSVFLLIILVLIALWNELFKKETLLLTISVVCLTIMWFIVNLIRIYGTKLNEVYESDNSEYIVKFNFLCFKKELVINSNTIIKLDLPNYANEKSKTVMYATLSMKNIKSEVKFKLTIQDAVEIYLFCQKQLNFKRDEKILNKIKNLSQNQNFIHLENIELD